MIFSRLFKRGVAKRTGRFSDFFRHASLEEQKKVVTEAARKANEDQRKVFRQAEAEMNTN